MGLRKRSLLPQLTGGSGRKKKSPGTRPGLSNLIPGNVLLSHAVYREVPSGLKGLTAVFGMGTGVAPSLRSPGNSVSLFIVDSRRYVAFESSKRVGMY